jgi:hypothetical protein
MLLRYYTKVVFLKSKGTMMSGIGITIGIGGMVGEDPRLGPLLIG